jgi:hypothetical protein
MIKSLLAIGFEDLFLYVDKWLCVFDSGGDYKKLIQISWLFLNALCEIVFQL